MAKELVRRLEEEPVIDDSLREEILRLNRLEYLCDKHELEWPIIGSKFNLLNVLKAFFN
jgi:hypothetical protein